MVLIHQRRISNTLTLRPTGRQERWAGIFGAVCVVSKRSANQTTLRKNPAAWVLGFQYISGCEFPFRCLMSMISRALMSSFLIQSEVTSISFLLNSPFLERVIMIHPESPTDGVFGGSNQEILCLQTPTSWSRLEPFSGYLKVRHQSQCFHLFNLTERKFTPAYVMGAHTALTIRHGLRMLVCNVNCMGRFCRCCGYNALQVHWPRSAAHAFASEIW